MTRSTPSRGAAPSVTTVYTRNSIYEVDQQARRIRRHSGLNAPTPNQVRWNEDGDWTEYDQIYIHGGELWIVWGLQLDDSGREIVRRTRTTRIQQQDGPPIRCRLARTRTDD